MARKTKTKENSKVKTAYDWAIPEQLEVPPDPLRLRLDFHNQVTIMYLFDGEVAAVQVVSAMDAAHALSRELSFNTGLLPTNTLWWANTREGPIYALWVEPKVWKLALQDEPMKPPRRFTCPMPGFIFLCSPGQPPWVFAVKRKPTKLSDLIYKAPLCNLYKTGRSCPGSHKYPMDVGKVPDSFFRSFFSPTADLKNRSEMFPDNVVHLWEFLDGKKKYPTNDLVKHGTVKDLMNQEMGR